MNYNSHSNIFIGAFHSLPEAVSQKLKCPDELLDIVGNYPDLFDDPSGADAKKDCIDPEWRKYIVFPAYLKAPRMHFWPGKLDDQHERIPMLNYLLDKMLEEYKCGNVNSFIKFSGCISHLFGDATQPAHLSPDPNMKFLSELMPKPDSPEFAGFHYHTSIEAVTGTCAALPPPELLGTSTPEAAWSLARRCREAVSYCRRFIVPIISALYRNDLAVAEALSVEPVTIAARLTADAMYTIVTIAEESYNEAQLHALNPVELRLLNPDTSFHDMVYGGQILDGSKDVPPNNVPVTPAKLKFIEGVKPVKGLGGLPHSGMNGPRECWMSWLLPKNVFTRFTACVGMHATLAIGGAAEFIVLLDGREVWRSGKMTCDDFARNINVDISNAESLTLKVIDANNGVSFWKNHCLWADPQLIK